MAILHPDVQGGRLVQSYTVGASAITTSGDNTVVAAPGAGNRLVMKEIVIQNESTTATTILVKSGSTTLFRAQLAGGQAWTFSAQQGEELRLGTNEAFIVNLSGANSHGVSRRYFTETA
jgi:hypothetical protein